ncbi:MAG: hypothetical protein DA408_03210 [Bacteroidetes bacterium]|nr:MAG: hypothetical protein C7N36_01005 [Bacteroidota bacterium]PTM14295.1 MAG: hypothetical protein DA408_03210 [Bacteroidota bacterium]
MRLVVNVILLLIAAALAYMLYKGIEEPIAFNNEKLRRKEIVVEKLELIRRAQEMYRDITGSFAPTFDTLTDVLANGQFVRVAVIGDPDDPNFTGTITYDTSYTKAIDSVRTLGMDLSTLRYVPHFPDTKLVEFKIGADTIEYQSTSVAVVEVGTTWGSFMGAYADPRFAKYDRNYSPGKMIKFGDLNKPNLSGNWE